MAVSTEQPNDPLAEYDDVPEGANQESRISQMYGALRARARAAAVDKAKQAATQAAKKLAVRAILPYLLPALAIIGLLLLIAGFAFYLITLFPGAGDAVQALSAP